MLTSRRNQDKYNTDEGQESLQSAGESIRMEHLALIPFKRMYNVYKFFCCSISKTRSTRLSMVTLEINLILSNTPLGAFIVLLC